MVGRLVAYKRFDLAIQAFNESGKRLFIIGDGVEYERLKSMAKPNVTLLGKVTEEELVNYMNNCKGLVFPGKEDFGITMAEAHAAGKPVIAFRGGGALDIIVEDETGVMFDEQNVQSLNDAIKRAESVKWDHKFISWHAKKFDKQMFTDKIDFLFKNIHQFENMDKKAFHK